jgi:ABC-type amino acid transport system permease subunit
LEVRGQTFFGILGFENIIFPKCIRFMFPKVSSALVWYFEKSAILCIKKRRA